MGVIRVLEPQVANQIAAGEVIERPASVVKELVENALDAGAARIGVEILGGGADRIRVTDDGSGMEREDALLALERHATSKIRSSEDLKAIATFGFRGEALPSIASVCFLRLETSTGGPAGATRIEARAGRIERVMPIAHPRGTTVEVEHLFQNTPARRKFLRSAGTETARIADLVGTIAAAHPAIAFVLASAGRELLVAPPAPSHWDRAVALVGPRSATALLPLEARSGGLRLTGLVSTPGLHRSTSRDERLYVNGRPVRDRRLLHAVQDAYATLLQRGRFPVVYLHLDVPAGEVDVNVHPAKSEVRFLRPSAVHDFVRRALTDTLRSALPIQALTGLGRGSAEALPAVAEAPAPTGPYVGDAGFGRDASGLPGPAGEARGLQAGLPATRAASDASGSLDRLPLAPLAQFRDSYILAAAPDGLVIVDQHAAHERVLYERLLKESRRGRADRQKLLFPLTVEVTPAQSAVLEDARETLDSLGFSLTPFGEGVLRVDEVPALLPIEAVEGLIGGLLEEFLEWRKTEGVDRLRHLVLATAACHAAVTARHRLEAPEMERLMDDLSRADNPMTCPHGRPVLLRVGLERLEREFRRR